MEQTSNENFKQSVEEDSDEDTPKENQSPRLTSSEDLSVAPSGDYSPQLSPNTTQGWGACYKEENDSIAESENVPIEDTVKKNNLEGMTHDFLHTNLEKDEENIKEVEDSHSGEENEDQPEGMVEKDDGEREKKCVSLGPQQKERPQCIFSGTPSMLYEEKTKTWFTDEFSNLVKMFPVQTFQSPVCEFTPAALEKLEHNVQSWVDASLCKTKVQEEQIEFESCKIEYDLEAKEAKGKKSLSRHGSVTDQACNTQTVTVKFLINEANIFTHAFEISSYMQDVKESLAKTFKCHPSDLQLLRDGKILSDSLILSELGLEPYGTVEIDIEAKGSLKTESMYEVPPLVPDVITVRVESATEDVRDVVVEIESRCIKKPFVGGYRHKSTGIEYHHAFTQTPSLYYKVSAEGKISRDTQTVEWKEKLQNTTYSAATQMAKVDHYVPCQTDKILTARKFHPVKVEEKVDQNAMAIIIQRHWRGYIARKKHKQLLAACKEFLELERNEPDRVEREQQDCLKSDIVHKIFPRTRADYELLYGMVEKWRKAEIKRISSIKTTVPKKAEFCLLLKKEIESLRTIEKYRLELKREKMAKKELELLDKCAAPITWTGYKGMEVSMETVHIQRAKELKELYYIMCQEDTTTEERIELLISLKYALKSYNPMMTNELIYLFEREVNCLVRGVKPQDLAMLRKRTQKLFIELMKDPEFNPEATKHVVFDWQGNENKVYFCQRCQRLKPLNEFRVFDKKIDKCSSCSWMDDIGRSRIDFQPYRFIIHSLRKDERMRKCFTSLAFIMQEKDFYYLIVTIWHCKSPLSEETDIKKLCLGRWDVTKDWTPWNCILLTTTEMVAHVRITDLNAIYQESFISEVGHKNKLARFKFSHLYKFDKQYTESGMWFAKYKQTPSGSLDS